MVGVCRLHEQHVVDAHARWLRHLAKAGRQSAIHRNQLAETSGGTPGRPGTPYPCVPFFFWDSFAELAQAGKSAVRQPHNGGEELVVALPTCERQSSFAHMPHEPTQSPAAAEALVADKLTQ